MYSLTCVALTTAGTGIVCLVLGLLLAGGPSSEDAARLSVYRQLMYDGYADDRASDVRDFVRSRLDRQRIKSVILKLSERPKLAGTKRDEENAQWTAQQFRDFGLENVELIPYHLRLPRPNEGDPNRVYLIADDNRVLMESTDREARGDVDPQKDVVPAFNAYAPAADVTATFVYVNYGRAEDFQALANAGIDVRGHICVARYGKIFRGKKVKHAEQRGALGVVLYTDPASVAPNGTSANDVYPNSFWLPGDGIQRGTINRFDGDPFSPGWPAKEWAEPLDESEADVPRIPSQPIGYDDARVILRSIGGAEAPNANWTGALADVDYRVGPSSGNRLRIKTNNQFVDVISYNVFGQIVGRTEPDRYVLTGNHRDSWGKGTTDATSGSGVMMELARLFGQAVRDTDWRPKRTMVFCSWGAEEYGLLGSRDHAAEFGHIQADRSVAYFNNDICSSGCRPVMKSSPLLADAILDAAMTVKMPATANSQGETTLYDEIMTAYRKKNDSDSDKPIVIYPGDSSDYSPFLHIVGVSAADLWMRFDATEDIYPSYHTGYETAAMLDLLDPDMRCHRVCAELTGELLLEFGESLLLPINASAYGQAMRYHYRKVREELDEKAQRLGVQRSFDLLDEAITRFVEAVAEFDTHVAKLRKGESLTPFDVRRINDQFMLLERAFIDPVGLPPNRVQARHPIISPPKVGEPGGHGFAGIVDLTALATDAAAPDSGSRTYKRQLQLHFNHVIAAVDRATSVVAMK